MLKNKIVWAFIPVVFTGLLFLGGCNSPSPEKFVDRVVEEATSQLQLNAAQQQQLNGIKAELLAKFAETKKSRESMHQEVLAELQRDTLDATELKRRAEAHRTQMHGIVDLAIDRLVAFHGTLTPEQKKKVLEFLNEKEQCRKHCCFGN